jgi:hypothetical protein
MNLKYTNPASDSGILHAVAVAMHRCGLFVLSGRPASEIAAFNASYADLGLNLSETENFDPSSPSGIGNILNLEFFRSRFFPLRSSIIL